MEAHGMIILRAIAIKADCPAETYFFAVLACDEPPTIDWLLHRPGLSLA
jgi:hypothetical protein